MPGNLEDLARQRDGMMDNFSQTGNPVFRNNAVGINDQIEAMKARQRMVDAQRKPEPPSPPYLQPPPRPYC